MRSAPRLAPAAPGPDDPPGEITDRGTVRKLLMGEKDWWEAQAPELAERQPEPSPAELAQARDRATLHLNNPDVSEVGEINLLARLASRRRREGERLRFLLDGGFLAGDALWEAAARNSA